MLAVAIRARAQVIVTFNEKQIPANVLVEFDLDTQHPDTSLRHLIDLAPTVVRARLENAADVIREMLSDAARQLRTLQTRRPEKASYPSSYKISSDEIGRQWTNLIKNR
ncbi:MAG: hypothetical protein AB7P31_01900 [Steroidobacteraceae bacterium]